MLKSNKLISLMRSWPHGAVFTSEWLIHEKGYSKGQLQQYSRSGWIELVGKGAYRRAEADNSGNKIPLQWQGGVYALQAFDKENSVIVAARTALELGGYSHFINMSGKQTVWLFTKVGFRVPTWFKNYKWDAQVKIHSPKLFSKIPDSIIDSIISTKNWGPFVTYISCPERAMMELLELCPKYESLDHAKLIMESLATLRPKVVSELLYLCTSIKVKRLFLALADLCNHEWLKEVDTKKIDLGSGKRILAPGYAIHPVYQISIPKIEKDQNAE